jgi:L-threonylcarbamoyladenylate synthase
MCVAAFLFFEAVKLMIQTKKTETRQDEMKTAVFLDRDGTLIDDRGHLRNPDDVIFYPETVPALLRLQRHARLFIVTNQSGVGNGLITSTEANRVNAHVVEQLRRQGVQIEQVYCCPHRRDENCSCIKPKPLFMQQAAQQYGLDLAAAFTVGDHPHDVQFARNAGATGIYVLTGHGRQHRNELSAETTVVPGIREAVEWIIGCLNMRQDEQARPGIIQQAACKLKEGGVAAFPTETVYGLGANTFDPRAIARIFEIKQRPHFDPLIVHVSSVDQLTLLTDGISTIAHQLIDAFWPGPLTLVLPKNQRVPDLVTSGLPTVAVRMPRHPLALELIRRAGVPLAAPSANPFGHTSPTTAQHVRNQLGNKVELVLDGGSCSVGVESTIVSLTGEKPVLLRAGGTPVDEIEQLTGPLERAAHSSDRPAAPGQLSQHYAPRTPLYLRANTIRPPDANRVGLLAFSPPLDPSGFHAVEVLSADGNLREAAANLFAAMHHLDAAGLDLILAEQVPDKGLGLAINDRIKRAACCNCSGTHPSRTGGLS